MYFTSIWANLISARFLKDILDISPLLFIFTVKYFFFDVGSNYLSEDRKSFSSEQESPIDVMLYIKVSKCSSNFNVTSSSPYFLEIVYSEQRQLVSKSKAQNKSSKPFFKSSVKTN